MATYHCPRCNKDIPEEDCIYWSDEKYFEQENDYRFVDGYLCPDCKLDVQFIE